MTASTGILLDVSVVENTPGTTTLGGVTRHGFMPGQSGNPGGRPKGLARRVRELVGEDGEAIAAFMLQVMLSERERTKDRLDAARFLAERGWGKPVQMLDVEVAPREPLIDPARLGSLSDEELETMTVLLEKAGLGAAGHRDAPRGAGDPA
jgi:hypothetical protein